MVLGDLTDVDLPVERTWRVSFQWIAATDFDLPTGPLPVILCSAPCRWRKRILATLDGAGTPWRVALESTNFTGVLAGVRGGMGVASLLAGDLSSDLRRIDPTARMPALPLAEIALQSVPSADRSALASDAIAWLSDLMDRRVRRLSV